MDNDCILGFQRDNNVKYVEVVSNKDFITMVAIISRGRQSMIEALMLIL